MAGRGAPEVSQCRITDMPSITVLSEGPAVMFGAIPVREAHRLHEKPKMRNTTHTFKHLLTFVSDGKSYKTQSWQIKVWLLNKTREKQQNESRYELKS